VSLRLAEGITLAALQDDSSPRSHIFANGRDTGAVADGVVLEAALVSQGHHLLFTTDDVPFEEGLHIQLFDANWARIDHADMVWPYATGTFRDLQIVAPDALTFAFFDAPAIRLELLTAPVRRLLPGGPRGVHRDFAARRWFELSTAD